MDWFAKAGEWSVLFAQLNRIERKLNALTVSEEKFNMATQAELDALNAAIATNTSDVASATAALQGYLKTVQDLTAQLQAAVAASDSAAIQAATAALVANNATLEANVPATAAAVVSNT